MIVNGVIISKDRNKFQFGMGLKLIKKASGLTSTKGSALSNVKIREWITNSSMKNNILL